MALIAGVNIPDFKRVEIALTRVHGIGPTRARQAVAAIGLDGNPRVRDLTEDQLSRLREVVDKQYRVEGDLKRQDQMNIRRKIEVRCFQGLRHTRGLPVRGQRSKTNARNRKGARKTVAGRRRTSK